jgi:hypothetical protein
MSSRGQVALKDVWMMLAECAAGHTIDEHTHHYWITFNGRLYPSFPKGEHGKANPPIQRGHVKRTARCLGIPDCAKEHLSL